MDMLCDLGNVTCVVSFVLCEAPDLTDLLRSQLQSCVHERLCAAVDNLIFSVSLGDLFHSSHVTLGKLLHLLIPHLSNRVIMTIIHLMGDFVWMKRDTMKSTLSILAYYKTVRPLTDPCIRPLALYSIFSQVHGQGIQVFS